MKKLLIITLLLTITILTSAQEKYAVLICGKNPNEQSVLITEGYGWGNPGDYSYNEFWNDTFLMWEMLVYEKGFDDDKVFVLYYDGDDYNTQLLSDRYNAEAIHIDDFPITDYSATKENLEMVFDGLATGTNGFPQITEDDFLFVWTFGHGTLEQQSGPAYIILYPELDYSDINFAQHLNNINCYKRVVWMQQCMGGNFHDNLENSKTVFHSAGSENETASVADDYWATENEIINSTTYQHGEYNFHMYSSAGGLNPNYENNYDIELFSDADLNNDNYISVYEVWQWEQSHETKPETPLYSDLGNIGIFTSLEYPTLLHQNIILNETHRGLIGISKTIHITAGNELRFYQNADVTLLNNAELIVDEGATLIIEDNVKLRGNTSNRIIVNSNIQIGVDVVLSREGNNGYFSGIYFYNENSTINLDKVTFENTKFHNWSKEFNVSNSTFSDCDIVYSYRGDVTFNNCNSYATWLYLENQDAINETSPSFISINNCNFSDQNSNIAAIHLENYKVFQIEENTIDGYYVGLQLMGTGAGSSGNQFIKFNEIMNGHVGINAYNTTSEIQNNNIHDNDFGIKINNNCNTNLEGNLNAGEWSQTQRIMDNSNYELYFSSGSFPWNFQYNIIVDEDNAGNPSDPMVYYQLPVSGTPLHDVRNNCWGSNFLPADDFYGGIYYYLPIWCPPAYKTVSIDLDSAKVLYMHAKAEFDSANYTTAKTKFMEVISNYSITKYASAAMKDMFALEQFENDNYQWLKLFYDTDSIIQNNTILKDLSNFLSNKCDIELQNWSLAINHYEEIIQNPPSYEDSIFAVIDLGQLYLLMENNNSREVV